MSSLAPPFEQRQPDFRPGRTRHTLRKCCDRFRSPVLEGISFQLPRGETKILMGVAGTGKTLILKLRWGC